MSVGTSRLLLVIGLAAVLGTASFVFYKKRIISVNSNDSKISLPSADIQKEYLAKSNGRLNTPAGRAWMALDFDKLVHFFGPKIPAKANQEFFQTALYIWDTQQFELAGEKKLELLRFQEKTIDFILSAGKTNSVMVSHYALRALRKMPVMCDRCEQRIIDAYRQSKDRVLKAQYFEFLVLAESLPGFIKRELLSDSIEDEKLQSVFTKVSQMKDPIVKKEICLSIFNRFERMSHVGQGISLKFFAYNRNLIQADLSSAIRAVSQRDDDLSQDAFLNSVQQLNLLSEHRSRVEQIGQRSPHIYIRSFAQSLLKSGE